MFVARKKQIIKFSTNPLILYIPENTMLDSNVYVIGTPGNLLMIDSGNGMSYSGLVKALNELNENLEEILSVSDVDGYIIGPYDLSGSLGVPGQFEHPEMLSALERVRAVSQAKNALAGFHVIPPELKPFQDKVAAGYRFIAHSLDILLLGENCRNLLNAAKAVSCD